MSDPAAPWRMRLAWAALAATVAGLLLLAWLRWQPGRLWGDEGTYLAMTASLARDGDLRFSEADRRWARERLPEEGVTVIVQRTEDGLAYSKPVLYPLLTAPLYLLVGEMALPLVNLLALAAALAAAWGALRRRAARDSAWPTLVAFLTGGLLLAYLPWRMSDALQAAAVLGGLALACGALRPRTSDGGRWLEALWTAPAGGVALGFAAAMRLPAAALVVGAGAAALSVGRPRRALAVVGPAAAAWLLTAALGQALTGAANPYKAVRTSFDGSTGYPTGPQAEQASRRFETQTTTSRIGWTPRADAGRVGYAALYFLIGRHTGLLLYFPCALLLVAVALRRLDRVGLALLSAAAAIALFYLVWLPWNYFGGSTFLGNRYFLSAYPALLLAVDRLPRTRQLVVVWLVTALAGSSAIASVWRVRDLDPMSQSHAAAGVFRLLPYESVGRRIDGQRDRYWAGDFVRFVDPYAAVEPYAFRLQSGDPPAELEVAASGPAGRLAFLVATDAPRAEISFYDWGTHATYRLSPGLQEIVLAPSRPWRRHRFWWTEEAAYRVRALRLAVRAPRGQQATAELRYLGAPGGYPAPPERQVERLELPLAGAAGAVDGVAVRVRNTGRGAWEAQGIVPVQLGYRLYPAGSSRPIEGPRQSLPAAVPPGEVLAARLPIRWPDQAGDYRLVIDLVHPGLGWFADRVGEPLAAGPVRVTAAASPAVE